MPSPAPPTDSPGPTLPGAWPPSHRRATTCPTPRPVVDPLHLEHILDFQQSLVHQMQSKIPSPTSFAPSISSDSAITPVDSLDSELTRFRTDISTSIIADTSVSTAYTSHSSPERLVTSKLPQLAFKPKRYSTIENEFPTRIPRPIGISSQRRNVFSSESSSPPRRQSAGGIHTSPSSLVGLARSGSSNASPVSPIIFSSPTSSSFPRVKAKQYSPIDRSSSYEYNSSPSWETSYGSEYNDRHMLNHSPSPSPSPIIRRQSLVPEPFGAVNRTPSIEIIPAPMLTSLSLPASPDTSMSLEMDPVVTTSPRLSPVDGDASPWSLSLSLSSPVLPTVPELPLSPVAGNTPDPQHVVSFPSPSTSSPFTSSFPSPIPDIESEMEFVNSSAAEYAAAVVSSAWAYDGPSLTQVIPQSLLLPDIEGSPIDSIADDEEHRLTALSSEPELPEPLGYLQNVPLPPPRQETKVNSILEKMKQLGDKVKRILRGRPKASRARGGVNVDVDVRRVGGVGSSQPLDAPPLPDVIDIHSRTTAAQEYEILLPSNDTNNNLPLPPPPPPGLGVRRPKTRPFLSSATYNNNDYTFTRSRAQPPPMIRIRPPSSSSHGVSYISNDRNPIDSSAPKIPSSDLPARPKTLEEIKSKRRLSLPALSNFVRPSSPNPSVNVITSNRRPVSALAFHPRPPPLSSLRPPSSQADVQTQAAHRLLQAPRPASVRPATSSAVSGTVRSESTPSRLATAPLRGEEIQKKADAVKKKNRHFSLSALSGFVGNWDEGSWQR